MELIILLSLMTAFASSASLDAEMCSAGESFWCQSLANAEACGAVDHCRESVWKNMQLEEERSTLSKASPKEKCRVCQKFFLSLQERLKITDDQDHGKICQQLAMCSLEEGDLEQVAVEWNMVHSRLNADQNNTLTCSGCQNLIEYIADRNFSGVIETTLLNFFCEGACPFQMVCKGFVKLLVPHIVNNVKIWLRSERIQFCTVMGYCNGSRNGASLPLHQGHRQRPTAKKASVCQLCIRISKTIIDSEAVKKNEATLLNAMRLVCDSLWWPHGNHCHRMVDAVGRPVLEKLSKRLHPDGVCQMIGFCDGASVGDFINDITETVASERCSYCQRTTEYLAALLSHGRAVNEIRSKAKRICEFHPFGMDKEECEFIFDKYTPILVDYLIDDLSRDNICQMEQFCGGESKILTEDVRATDDDFILLD